MTSSEIIKLAKFYFGKDRTNLKKLVLSYKFDRSEYRWWKRQVRTITSHTNRVQYGINNDVVQCIKDDKLDQIDWNFIGDLSWKIDFLLNPNVRKGHDWDKKLALRCKGKVRLLSVFISDVIPCYTYDWHYMSYSNTENFYEFGPILKLTKSEKQLLEKVEIFLKRNKFQFVGKPLAKRKFKHLYSDVNSGNASLFDVLFSDFLSYEKRIDRLSDKEIVEKNGNRLRWRERFNRNGTLNERTESRWTKSGDYFRITLDGNSQITKIDITRKQIGRKKFERFELDIEKASKRRKASALRKKNS